MVHASGTLPLSVFDRSKRPGPSQTSLTDDYSDHLSVLSGIEFPGTQVRNNGLRLT